jgi:hypothetical protein
MALAGCLRIVAVAFLAASALLAEGGPDIKRSAESVVRELDVQQKLPHDSGSTAADDGERPPDWSPGMPEGPDVAIPADAWGILKWAVYAIVIVAAIGWLGTWASESWQRRHESGIPTSASLADSAAAPLDPVRALALADEWAAAGRYGAAMHQVLLAAVATLAPRLAHRAPDSLTSWELLNAAALQADQRAALRDVVSRVDRAWFGKQPAALADYQAVRISYRSFTAAALAESAAS